MRVQLVVVVRHLVFKWQVCNLIKSRILMTAFFWNKKYEIAITGLRGLNGYR
jgi:hypothetical protein